MPGGRSRYQGVSKDVVPHLIRLEQQIVDQARRAGVAIDANEVRQVVEAVLQPSRPVPGISPEWLGNLPELTVMTGAVVGRSFADIFEANGHTVHFIVDFSANIDGTGGVPAGLDNLMLLASDANESLLVDARMVSDPGVVYYRISAITVGATQMANISSNRARLTIMQRTGLQFGTLPALIRFEGLSSDTDFSAHVTEGTPPASAFGVETALNPDGTGDLPASLSNLQVTVPTGQTLRVNATGVTLGGTNDVVIHYRLWADAPNSPRVYSDWAQLTIRNAVTASWMTIPDQTAFEGVNYVFSFAALFVDGTPQTMTFSANLYNAATGNDPPQHEELDTELTITVDSANQTATFSLGSVDVTATREVWFDIVAQQPEPMNPV